MSLLRRWSNNAAGLACPPTVPVHDGREKGVTLEIGHQCYLGTKAKYHRRLGLAVHDGKDKRVALEIGYHCYLGDER